MTPKEFKKVPYFRRTWWTRYFLHCLWKYRGVVNELIWGTLWNIKKI